MATTTSITTTYAGEKLEGYISAALLSPNTIEGGGVKVVPNVKYKKVIKRLDVGDLIEAGTCDFTDTSTVTLFERYLEPKEFQVNLKLCKQDFRSDWDAIQMGYSIHDSLPSSFADYLMAEVVGKVAEDIEKNIWQGDNSADATSFEGIIARIKTDKALNTAANTGTGNDVIGVDYLPDSETPIYVASPTTITSSNVLTELGKVADAIPQVIYGKEDLQIYVSNNVMRAYVRALGGFGLSTSQNHAGTDNKGTQWYNGGALSFDGIPLFMAQGLPADTMIAAESNNFHYACGLLSDKSEARVLDMADLDGSQNVRIILRFTADVNYAKGGEIIYYGAA